MTSYPRKESGTSIASTKSALSTIINTSNNCLYKKEILGTLLKLPSKGIVKKYIKNNNNFSINEKKEKPVIISPNKNNKIIQFSTSKIKNLILNHRKNRIFDNKKSKIENITFQLEELFNIIQEKFTNGKNCVNECKEWIDFLNENIDFILDKINANEYMPLISICINVNLFSIILICNLSDNGKYNLFKYDTNKIFDNSKLLNECIYERSKNISQFNLKDKNEYMTNLYKNITNSLNIIISKYNQFIPSISKEFETLIKNIRRITYNELYNFYFDYIKNPKKIKEFQLDFNDSKIKNNKVFQSYRSFNKNKNNSSINFQKEIRGFSVDNVNNNMNINYNQNFLNSSNNSFRTIKSENLNYISNINNLNTYSSDGIFFPYKKIRSQSQGQQNNNFQYYNFSPTKIQYSINDNIYNIIGNNNSSNNIKFIIKEITNPNENYSNFNKNENINEINNPINNNIYSPLNQNSERNNKRNLLEIFGNLTPESKSMSSRNSSSNRKYLNNTIDRKNNIIKHRNKILSLPLIPFPNNKEYTLLIHLDDTIIHIPNKSNNIYLRNGLIDFLNSVNEYYEVISFTKGNENYSNQIINLIESNEKYFDYCLHKDNATYLNEEYYKDINKIGRNVKKTIIIDDKNNNLGIEDENTIFIKSFIINENDNENENDNVLNNLSSILISIAKEQPHDIRKSLRMYKKKL